MAVVTAPSPVRNISPSSSSMRALPRWSASSLATTTPMPVQGDPLRRMGHPLEILGVDLVQAGLGDADLEQPSLAPDDAIGNVAAHVLRRLQMEGSGRGLAHADHARNRGQGLGIDAVALDLAAIAAAQHPPRELAPVPLQAHPAVL